MAGPTENVGATGLGLQFLALVERDATAEMREDGARAFYERLYERHQGVLTRGRPATSPAPTAAEIKASMAEEMIAQLEAVGGAPLSDRAKTHIESLLDNDADGFADLLVQNYTDFRAAADAARAARNQNPPPDDPPDIPNHTALFAVLSSINATGDPRPNFTNRNLDTVPLTPHEQTQMSDRVALNTAFDFLSEGRGTTALARLLGVPYQDINSDSFREAMDSQRAWGPRSPAERQALITESTVGIPNADPLAEVHSATHMTTEVTIPGEAEPATMRDFLIEGFRRQGFTFADDAAEQAFLEKMVELKDDPSMTRREFSQSMEAWIDEHDGVTAASENVDPDSLADYEEEPTVAPSAAQIAEWDAMRDAQRNAPDPVAITEDEVMAALEEAYRHGGEAAVEAMYNESFRDVPGDRNFIAFDDNHRVITLSQDQWDNYSAHGVAAFSADPDIAHFIEFDADFEHMVHQQEWNPNTQSLAQVLESIRSADPTAIPDQPASSVMFQVN